MEVLTFFIVMGLGIILSSPEAEPEVVVTELPVAEIVKEASIDHPVITDKKVFAANVFFKRSDGVYISDLSTRKDSHQDKSKDNRVTGLVLERTEDPSSDIQ